MRKILPIFMLYVLVFFMFLSFCQNSIIASLEDIKPYAREINFIINDYNTDSKTLKCNIDNYINRIENIKSGLSNLKRPYVLNEYFDYEIKSVENLKIGFDCIKKGSKSSDVNKYVDNYNKYFRLSQKELKIVLKKTLLQ